MLPCAYAIGAQWRRYPCKAHRRQDDMTNRLNVRLNSEYRRRLDVLAQEEGATISDVVRRMIDAAYEDILHTRRQQAVERLIGLNLEDPPAPDTISRELEAAHGPGGLC